MQNFLKDCKRYINIFVISWILFNRRRPNSLANTHACCLNYISNTMAADFKSQGINRHAIDSQSRNIPPLVPVDST